MGIDVRKLLNTYEFETELPGSKSKIKFKPITTGMMKKLLVYEDDEDIETLDNFLDDLITQCVLNEDFNIDDLYLQDRFYLLLEIRKKTKGNFFKFNYICSKCKLESIQTVDLSDLELTELKENTGPVKVNDNLSLEFQHITRGMQKIAYKNAPETDKINKKLAEVATYSYALSIKALISGEERDEDVSIEDRIYLLDSLDSEEYKNVMKWFKDNDFGIDFTYEIKCKNPKCKNEEKKMIPISNFFG